MLVVKIELHPCWGGPAKLLGQIELWNEGTTSNRKEVGDYCAKLDACDAFVDTFKPAGSVKIRSWDRSLPAWRLVAEALKAMAETWDRRRADRHKNAKKR